MQAAEVRVQVGGTTISRALGYKENPAVCKWNPGWCKQACKNRPMCLEYILEVGQFKTSSHLKLGSFGHRNGAVTVCVELMSADHNVSAMKRMPRASFCMQAKDVQKYWADYFVFTLVRNPFARAVSSWNHVNTYALKAECR